MSSPPGGLKRKTPGVVGMIAQSPRHPMGAPEPTAPTPVVEGWNTPTSGVTLLQYAAAMAEGHAGMWSIWEITSDVGSLPSGSEKLVMPRVAGNVWPTTVGSAE